MTAESDRKRVVMLTEEEAEWRTDIVTALEEMDRRIERIILSILAMCFVFTAYAGTFLWHLATGVR